MWIDWVADLGDGFDSTYAMASLLSRKELKVGDIPLPRGEALSMGGDEVYPKASRQAYMNQLRQPYAWAAPDHDRKDDKGRPVARDPRQPRLVRRPGPVPGLLLQGEALAPRRMAVLSASQLLRDQITESWWLWATDIQLADDMDQPQADYFKHIAASMPENSQIILCSAEPGWLYTDSHRSSWEDNGIRRWHRAQCRPRTYHSVVTFGRHPPL